MGDKGIPRPCERRCSACKEWLHFSRFRKRVDTRYRVGIHFNEKCKACEQKERNERKNIDRPQAILKQRVAAWAQRLNVSMNFLWVNMNWQALLLILRAAMTPDGLCLSCGHRFDNERDIQLEHRAPPRFVHDWARHHARNIGILCTGCNVTKNDATYTDWLDEQEAARKSNEGGSGNASAAPLLPFGDT